MKCIFVQNEMFHISCVISLLFMKVLVLQSRVHHCSYLFLYQNFIYLFIYLFIYFDESTAFTLITTCTEHKLFFRITASFPRYLLQKVSIRVLWLLHFVIYFYSEVVLQDLSKNNPAEKQIHADILSDTKTWISPKM